jgi:hypothetical protein
VIRIATILTIVAAGSFLCLPPARGDEKVADKIAHEQDIRDGIAGLIVAGERLTEEISSRF